MSKTCILEDQPLSAFNMHRSLGRSALRIKIKINPQAANAPGKSGSLGCGGMAMMRMMAIAKQLT